MLENLNLILICSIGGLIIGMILFQLTIPLLHYFKFGQSIRKEGPTRHLTKKGTPTMGGLVIVIITLLLFSLYLICIKEKNQSVWLNSLLLLIPFVCFSIIGFIDDFLIIIKKTNQGLPAIVKFLLQLVVSGISYYLIMTIRDHNALNFFGYPLDLRFLYGVIIVIGFSGITNATNLTDGLDGLLSGCAILSFLGVLVVSVWKENTIVTYFCLSIIIALIAFSMFNFPKAKIFMGDVGSLAIGAALFASLIALNMELLFFFFGFIYFIETISVILQVWFFKKTKGNRLFKMTPLHHHFELLGLKEEEIDVIFWIITFIFTIIGIILGVKVF